MSWITTDTDVACALVVHKNVYGNPVRGYPKTYSILGAFGSFPEVAVNDWHKMEPAPRNERIEAFKNYISLAEGIDVDAVQTNSVYRPSDEDPDVIVEP